MTLSPDVTDWIDICALEDIPRRGARRMETARSPLAIFRTGDDQVFTLVDECPHKRGPLSMGIVHGRSVTCPLHAWAIDLQSGHPLGADAGGGCTPRFATRVENGRIQLDARAFAA